MFWVNWKVQGIFVVECRRFVVTRKRAMGFIILIHVTMAYAHTRSRVLIENEDNEERSDN